MQDHDTFYPLRLRKREVDEPHCPSKLKSFPMIKISKGQHNLINDQRNDFTQHSQFLISIIMIHYSIFPTPYPTFSFPISIISFQIPILTMLIFQLRNFSKPNNMKITKRGEYRNSKQPLYLFSPITNYILIKFIHLGSYIFII